MADGDDAYRGALGAFPYAFRASDSWTFRSYVAVAGTLAAVSLALMVLALVGWIASTANQSMLVVLSRGFLVVVWLFVVVPTVAPVLLVARRHRRGRTVDPRYDPLLAATGYLFVASLYVALLASAPPGARGTPPAAVAPLVEALYALPPLAGLAPPAVAAALIVLAHRRLGDVRAGAGGRANPGS